MCHIEDEIFYQYDFGEFNHDGIANLLGTHAQQVTTFHQRLIASGVVVQPPNQKKNREKKTTNAIKMIFY